MTTTGEYELDPLSVLRAGPPVRPDQVFEVKKVVSRWVVTGDDLGRDGFTIIAKDDETTLYIPVTEGPLPEVGDFIHCTAPSIDVPFPELIEQLRQNYEFSEIDRLSADVRSSSVERSRRLHPSYGGEQ